MISSIRNASVTSVELASFSETLCVVGTSSSSASQKRALADWAERVDAQREVQLARCSHQLQIVAQTASVSASSMVAWRHGKRESLGLFVAKRHSLAILILGRNREISLSSSLIQLECLHLL